VERSDLARWIDAYERAWRTAGTAALEQLFTADASYRNAPFAEPVSGLQAIAAFWEAERAGPGEPFTMRWELVAVEGSVGVARVEVTYAQPAPHVYRDLWVITLERDGRCRAFEEWPFFPGQPLTAAEAG
jgi:SnoaL-like domain